jgi:hypothetical protein
LVSGLEEFGIMARVLGEQCVVVAEGPDEADQTMVARMKDPKDVPCSSVQFPSDSDAAHGGHRGKGYQVQMAETVTAPGEKGAEGRHSRLGGDGRGGRTPAPLSQ